MTVRQGLVQQVVSVVVAGSVFVAAPGAARADDAPRDPTKAPARAEDPARASTLAEAAAARAKQGNRRVAIDLYEEAYAAAPRKEYLLQIGILYDNLAHGGDSRDVRLALLYLERFLAEPGPVPDRPALDERVTRLRTWKSRMHPDPQAPPAGPTPIHIFAYDPEQQYQVEVRGQACTTPCTMELPPGINELKADGPGPVNLQLVVPPRPGQIRLAHYDRSMFTAGAVMLPFGFAMGAGMWALAFACPSNFNSNGDGCMVANLVVWPILGAATMITGIVFLARGKVSPPPDSNRIDLVGRGAPPLRITSFGLAPHPGGGTGGLTFEF